MSKICDLALQVPQNEFVFEKPGSLQLFTFAIVDEPKPTATYSPMKNSHVVA